MSLRESDVRPVDPPTHTHTRLSTTPGNARWPPTRQQAGSVDLCVYVCVHVCVYLLPQGRSAWGCGAGRGGPARRIPAVGAWQVRPVARSPSQANAQARHGGFGHANNMRVPALRFATRLRPGHRGSCVVVTGRPPRISPGACAPQSFATGPQSRPGDACMRTIRSEPVD